MLRSTSPPTSWRLIAALLLSGAAGCSRPPQVASANRELIVSLATAVSARNSSWLDENARLLEQRRSAGRCIDSEYATFKAIIDEARAGDWKSAEDAVYAVRDDQEPTSQDLDNLGKRTLGSELGMPKSAARVGRKAP